MDLTIYFCGNCGSAIYKTATKETFRGQIVLMVGTMNDGDGIEKAAPAREFYVKYRGGWVQPVIGAAQDQEFP